ncbi:MAG: ATP-dependent Clp protease ATP-binding subunit [bacterium]|nr:ATP-dependent Clp protease ATP-binding subunit [bacterium]
MRNYTAHFYDSRFQMTHAGRLLIRLINYSTYGITIAACATFLLSDIQWLFWSGILLLLFLLDGIMHVNEADRSLLRNLYGDVNLALFIAPKTFTALEYAYERALFGGGNFYLFLMRRLLERKDIRAGLVRMDLDPKEIRNKVDEALQESLQEKKYTGDKKELKKRLQDEIEKIVINALPQAQLADNRFIKMKDIFAALSYCDSNAVLKILHFFEIDTGDLENALIFSRFQKRLGWFRWLPMHIGGFAHRPYKIRHRIMNRAWSARPTPILDQCSVDLTDLARIQHIGFLIGHEEEYRRMVDVLGRQARPNVLLVGDPGSGKDTIVSHLAFKIIKDDVPPELFDKRLVMLQIGSLIAGAEQSELQKRLHGIVNEIVQAGNIILYIPDTHNLAKTSGKAAINAIDILLPVMSSSAFSVIGATYPQEYKQSIEPHGDFAKIFEIIRVEEISVEQATRLLIYDSIILERQFRIVVTLAAIKQSVLLASKYFRDKLLPSSAEDLLKESLSEARSREDKVLNGDDVVDVAQRRVNIPLRHAEDKEATQLLNLEATIHQRLVDQQEAVKAVSQALREYRSGLSRKGGPIASFLFIGPTGVGKTELSKILASVQFGSEEAMIRFDMSEYQDVKSIYRFIGSPDGTTSGNLTESVLKNPYSLILLDEFEKAHPDILNIFLQVFDDGRLTDNTGRVVDFQNTIIIATSNAHSEFIKSSLELGKAMSEVSEVLKKKLSDHFRPELINRFSGIIVFKNLSHEDTIAIARLLIAGLVKDVKKSHGIELVVTDEAIEKIAALGYDPVFGARPLRGVISDKVRSALAEKILKQELARGDTITFTCEGDTLTYK